MVELAEHAVEEVPLGGGVPVTVLVATPAVVELGARRCVGGGEGPEAADVVETVVLHPPSGPSLSALGETSRSAGLA